MRLILFCFLLLAGVSFGAGAAAPSAHFEYQDEKLPFFEEARVFHGNVDGIDVVGVDVGPKDGLPGLVVGGYTTSFPYLRKFVRSLNEHGVRVFLFNPPGQGRGELKSGRQAPADQLGIDGMLKVYSAVRHFAFETTGKKVVAIGHSLGGLQVRLGSLGVVFDEKGEARISRTARARAREETALIVPMFSFALFGNEAFESHSDLKAIMLKDVAPIIIDCVASVGCFLPGIVGKIPQFMATQYLKFFQGVLHRGLFGADNLDHSEVDDLGHFIFPQNVSYQIREDLTRWLSTKKFTTSSGLDLGQEWEKVQKGANPFPVLYVGATSDSVTALKPFAAEADSMRTAHMITVNTGHIGALLSETVTPALAQLIARAHQAAHDLGCEVWLKLRNLNKTVEGVSSPAR